VTVTVQLLFWSTPIIWPLKIIPEQHHWWLQLSPFYYITEGYRDALLTGEWLWSRPWHHTALFWVMAIGVFLIGHAVFRRLRPHFADVL
jgi:ABC-type polysaccharide/polyol phosphate export permease